MENFVLSIVTLALFEVVHNLMIGKLRKILHAVLVLLFYCNDKH